MFIDTDACGVLLAFPKTDRAVVTCRSRVMHMGAEDRVPVQTAGSVGVSLHTRENFLIGAIGARHIYYATQW